MSLLCGWFSSKSTRGPFALCERLAARMLLDHAHGRSIRVARRLLRLEVHALARLAKLPLLLRRPRTLALRLAVRTRALTLRPRTLALRALALALRALALTLRPLPLTLRVLTLLRTLTVPAARALLLLAGTLGAIALLRPSPLRMTFEARALPSPP